MKFLKPRWLSLYFILLLDFLVLPWVLMLVPFLFEKQPNAIDSWLADYNPIRNITELIHMKLLWQSWLVLQGAVIVLLIKIFWRDIPSRTKRVADGIGGPEASGNGQFGTSRWITTKEMRASSTQWHLNSSSQRGGIVLGVDFECKNPFAYIETGDANTIILGATRAGKTRRLIYPSIDILSNAGESMIITDPKGEVYDRSSAYLKSIGYNIRVFDFRKPGWGNRINYLDPVVNAIDRGDIAEATKQAWSIAHMFVYQKPGSDKGEAIWRDGPESVIASLILVVAMEAPKSSQKHMYSVYKILLEMGRTKQIAVGNRIIDYVPLTNYLDSLPLDHPARDAYGTAALAPDRTRGSFFSSAASLLKLFSDPSIAYLTSYQDHVITDVGDEKTAIFLIIPDEDKTRHPYAALYINQVYDALVEHANKNNGRLKIRTNMLLDEFGNMPPFPDFDTKLTVSLGRGIRWNMVLQAYSQLNEKYGQHVTSTIKSNAQNTIFLKTTDQQTMNELSKRIGTYTIQTEGNSYNVGKANVNHGGSTSYTGRSLLTPDEIERWPNTLSLVLRGGYHPAKLPLPDLSSWPTDQKFVAKGFEEDRLIEKVEFFLPDIESLGAPEVEPEDMEEEGSYMDVD